MAQGRLVGKTAIVTGGGSGIGRATSQVFAKEGASVLVLDLNENGMSETLQSLSSNHGNKHCSIKCDVTSEDQVKHAIKYAEVKLGRRATILVNAAGISRPASLTDMTEESFDIVVGVNLKGTFLMAKNFVTALRRPGEELTGSIINIASIGGKVGYENSASYSASKAGVIGLTKNINLEFARYNIRCNAVLPGIILTPMTQGWTEWLKEMEQKTPMRKIGKPEDIANACLFLASEESSFISGISLEVTGGLFA